MACTHNVDAIWLQLGTLLKKQITTTVIVREYIKNASHSNRITEV
jgi:hypothetical protein